jgi:hypothetical protein
VEKAFHGLFPRWRTSKKPRFFKVHDRRIQRRMTLFTGCEQVDQAVVRLSVAGSRHFRGACDRDA